MKLVFRNIIVKKLLTSFLLLLLISQDCCASALKIKLGAQATLVASIFVGLVAYNNAIVNKKPSEYTILGDVSKLDPEFYEFCKKITGLVGIKKDLNFIFYKHNTLNFFTTTGYYQAGTKNIYINHEFYKKNKSLTINTLVHELEHYRQFNNYSGSYKGRDSRLLETGADAAAAGFFECVDCLKKIKNDKNSIDLAEKGYFYKNDYQCYLDRLQENPRLCNACVKDRQWFSKDLSSSWFDYLSLH